MKRDQAGAAAVMELVLVVPAFVMFVIIVVALGRMGGVRESLDSAARDAARAASLARSVETTSAAATAAAAESLAAANAFCRDLQVAVETSEFRPGGWVRVDLSCTLALGDLAGVWAPGSSVVHARSVAVVDAYRSIG